MRPGCVGNSAVADVGCLRALRGCRTLSGCTRRIALRCAFLTWSGRSSSCSPNGVHFVRPLSHRTESKDESIARKFLRECLGPAQAAIALSIVSAAASFLSCQSPGDAPPLLSPSAYPSLALRHNVPLDCVQRQRRPRVPRSCL